MVKGEGGVVGIVVVVVVGGGGENEWSAVRVVIVNDETVRESSRIGCSDGQRRGQCERVLASVMMVVDKEVNCREVATTAI